VWIDTAGANTAPPEGVRDARPALSFDVVYEAHFPFVWRTVRRLGIPENAVDDVVQDVFLVVHRRLSMCGAAESIRAWLFSITRRVVRNARRSLHRKPAHLGGPARSTCDVDAVASASALSPHDAAIKAEALRTVHSILDAMPDERREVFVLADLEQMNVTDIARAVGANVNTVYARLRAARADFDRAAARARVRDEWRTR
jgi:RNA polymerase sigma-70 factor (ECF subfamily)